MSALPDSPYKGLTAFDDSDLDALLFFGREREREIVVANLIASRLTVLYGPSGRRQVVAPARCRRPLAPRAAGGAARRRLRRAGATTPRQRSRRGRRRGAASSRSSRSLETLERAQSERDVYLVLDQVEEYFLYHEATTADGARSRMRFRVVLAAPLRVNVLVSLREDALAKLDRFAGRIPGLFANTLRLDRLDREAARTAIVRPARARTPS